MLSGIDISSYQSGLDLSGVPYDFVLIKATEGEVYVNPFCDEHYQQAKAAGKRRALYHYANGGDAVTEANHFVDNCQGYIRDALLVLDWEGEGVEYVGWAKQFLDQVESRVGYKPAIYMSEWVENNYDWSPVVANDNGLWIAKYSDYEIDNDYNMDNAGLSPNTKHWPFYFMWQWTSKGRLNGYAGDLDCDIFYGDGATWDAYAGIQPAVAEPASEPTPEPPADPTPAPTPDPTPDPVPTPPAPGTIVQPDPQPNPLPDPQPEPEPTPDPTPAPPAPILPPVTNEVPPVNELKKVVLSKKFLLALASVVTFLANGQYDQALLVVLVFLGVQGAIDHVTAKYAGL